MPEIELQQQVRDLEHKAQSYQSTIQKVWKNVAYFNLLFGTEIT